MTSCQQRQTLLTLIGQSCDSGARLQKACALIGLGARTVQRWQHPGNQQGDLRVGNKRRITVPANKLSEAERQAALELINSEQLKDLPPSQIVPRLADQGLYVASESSLYRLLREVGQLSHRRLERVATSASLLAMRVTRALKNAPMQKQMSSGTSPCDQASAVR